MPNYWVVAVVYQWMTRLIKYAGMKAPFAQGFSVSE